MKEIETILQQFNAVSLAKIDKVKLMNRIDRKYWFHFSMLEKLLEEVVPDYDVLEINKNRLMKYQSAYFDTDDNYMYLKHHIKKLNRYKVRRRTYLTTNEDFFEIKFKTNKRRTIKQRIQTEFNSNKLVSSENSFLDQATPFKGQELINSLNNRFYRITLIHKKKLDRCTIDIQPEFWNEKGEVQFKDLVIIELKKGRSLKNSPMLNILRKLKVHQHGLSKYCTGRAFLDPKLNRNAFKPRLRFIEKHILN
ncbi:polyphosphate polymerase domain-containing protein [Prolixibacteraceae bacterium Z1-6]|uniref:Polyphosphate polymerase domain-containing protein n=1 Tax=Draconibacterium aestuarii TaxID=2998507 RepID=A0A9X3F7L6_9BACT|nr:polyphosphate polymerase domain-containing protein [Prolixibacteraceae bacterium Z1-6]